MISLRRLSIPKKIVAIAMIISASALFLAGGALATYDFVATRADLISNTTTLARIIADNTTAAVSFNDPSAAEDTLNALRAEPSIIAACVYMGSKLLAQHLSHPGITPCPLNPISGQETSGNILVSTPIVLKGKQIGQVQLRSTLAPAYAHLRLEILTIGVILLLSVIFAFGLSSRLQRLVSEPILSLTRTARHVSRQRDYSVRGVRHTEDEIGTLVDSFNEMLDQIEARKAELEAQTAALAEANEELQKANKMKDEFLATLSHELRTPLTSIFGWVGMLRNGVLDAAKTQKAIEVIERNLKAQLQIVNDLLNMSRIVTGQLKIRPQWTDAGNVIQSAVDSIQPAATAKGIRVVVEIPNRAEPVFLDPERFQQVLWNLLTNAVKFTGRGGEVKIQAMRIQSGFQIRVADNGEGIDPEFIPQLFRRFTQADASTTRKHGGLGLGLAIAQHIVESHGGTITAQSRGKGSGSTFFVQLPIPESRPVSALEPAIEAPSLHGLRIMIVEDELDTREMIAEGLESYGAYVLLAASGAEALRILSRQHLDVLVCDIGMPVMDGHELMRIIRSDSSGRMQDTPAIALTAFAFEEDKKKSLAAGYQAHLVKPVAMGDLVHAIAAIAGNAKSST